MDRILSSLREYIDSQDGDEGLKEEMKHDIADLKEYRANLVADPERWLSYKIGNDFSCLPTKRLRQHVDGTPIAAEASANSNATVPAPMLSQQQQQQQQQPLPSLPLLTNADITERKLPQTQLDEMPLPKKVRVAIETLSQLGNAHADRQQQPQEQQQLSSQEFTLPPLRFLSD